MKEMRTSVFMLCVLPVLFIGCANNASIVESDAYRREEIRAYNNILNDIVDSTYYLTQGKKAVFFLFDSLTELNNLPTNEDESEKEYLEVKLPRRKIDVEEITGIGKYKFIKATRHPKDSPIIQWKDDEYFTRRWLTFSRICFDKDLAKGFLFFKSWCGNLCSHGDRLDIQKVNRKWRVKTRHRGPVS
jgi:hypothetical protein